MQTDIYTYSYIKNKYFALFSVFFGNSIEYYDYALYGFLAPIMAQHFFPPSHEGEALLQTFGVFAIGSLSKPLGALIFGSIGDLNGRKLALKWNMLGIAIPTCMIALLPGYLTWGLWSPLCLIICRVSQGLFLGGQNDGVRIYVLEYVKNYPCLANSMISLSSSLGIYTASYLASKVLSFSYYESLWRLLFVFGGMMSFIFFFIRKYMNDTPTYIKSRKIPAHTWMSILKKNYTTFIGTVFLTGSVGGMYHFFMIFLGNYLSKILQIISVEIATHYISISVLCYAISAPLGGFIADLIGVKKTMYYAGLSLVVFITNVCYCIMHQTIHLAPLIMISLFLGIFSAPSYVLIINHFRVKDRYRLISVGHSLGSMFFSGTAPMVVMALWNFTQQPEIIFSYFIFLLVIGLVSVSRL